MKTVEIYGQSGCRYCAIAVRHCRTWQIPFEYHDIGEFARKREMFERYPAATTVPQIFIGEHHVGGCDDLVAIPVSQLQQMVVSE